MEIKTIDLLPSMEGVDIGDEEMCVVSYWLWGQDICDWIWLTLALWFDRDPFNVFRIPLVSSSSKIDWFWETHINCRPEFNMEMALSSNVFSADWRVAFAEVKSTENESWYVSVKFDYSFSNSNCSLISFPIISPCFFTSFSICL